MTYQSIIILWISFIPKYGQRRGKMKKTDLGTISSICRQSIYIFQFAAFMGLNCVLRSVYEMWEGGGVQSLSSQNLT